MSAVKIVTYVLAAILLIFGVLYILAAFSPQNAGSAGGVILTGIILVVIGLVLIFFATRIKSTAASGQAQNVTLNIDLPANVKPEAMKCQSCGGVLTMDNIQMVAGAPVVHCPYCKTSYQLSEEPKW